MVGHARLACDEGGHWISRLARAEQVGRREEVKVAASENRTQSESVRVRGERREDIFFTTKDKVFGVIFFV
jgi:hypothetical protein